MLDGSGDPDPARVGRGWIANTSRAVEDRFPDFAAWAADPARDDDGLRLAEQAFLLSPASGAVNGAHVPVDGGQPRAGR